MISKGCKSIFPIKHQEIWDRYKQHIQSFWTTEEVSLQDDLRDLQTLKDGEKHFIKQVLAYFANSEAMINENLASRFYNEILIPEARCFITMQMANESIHAEMYGLQIEAYVSDREEKEKLFSAIENVPCINHKAQWVAKWLNGKQNLLTRLIAFGLVEGLFFAGSFCAIYYFRKRGLLPGLALSNDWIARDEGMHFSFSALMYKILRDKYNNSSLTDSDIKDLSLITANVPQSEFEEIVREAVDFEKEFVKDALPVDLIGMNKEMMCQYIEAVADRIADLFEFERVFNTENPFDFMRALDVQGVTNFFEKRVSEYQRPTDRSLSFDENF
ncbi:MAG: ribonucleoside-diphosphate reductase [Pelagibacteraceae bacterium]|nr:ribonucleoside-diphosphate reductase [Pelagibacteraceae bacterium]|tara:strand:- start:1872 stop:2861 length:990 start_codon:yes stop_codon:yes gene_type:complete